MFGHLSVTLSNTWRVKKCVGNYCTLSLAVVWDMGFASGVMNYLLI